MRRFVVLLFWGVFMPSVFAAGDDEFAVPGSVVVRDSVLDAKENGLVPDTGKDCTALLSALLEKARSQPATTLELAPGRVKIYGGLRVKKTGHLLIFRHHPRTHAGIFVHGCRKVMFEGVEVWGTAGLGILSQQSADLTCRRTNVRPEPGTGLFCGPKDDGFHFFGCSGHTRHVTISGNKATGPLPATAIRTVGENDDLNVAPDQPFSLKP